MQRAMVERRLEARTSQDELRTWVREIGGAPDGENQREYVLDETTEKVGQRVDFEAGGREDANGAHEKMIWLLSRSGPRYCNGNSLRA